MVVDPRFWIGYFQFAQLSERVGNQEDALAALAAGERYNGNSKMLSLRGYIQARLGRVDEARRVLETLEAISRERYVPPYSMALVHLGLGDAESTVQWLERAFAVHDVHLIFLPVDPKWDEIRSDPRFRDLVSRCGFAKPSEPVGSADRDVPTV